ncbi:tautomerase family protein [Roseibium sediminicola]|uniref:Tautomerase family protein n=1 Tax=Roseibium sediminicola TaxID=2933272 RepID=A0ABT0GXG7_9HYPH|nr:tautomerase family protein [Roseibium sp. CAU 1639]MCK7614131.1 tautomerase family protein [Roseibium sp. CAU 1639]
MPLTQVSIRKGSKTEAQKNTLLNEIYQAMRETFDVPEDDRFMTITEHAPEDFVFGRHYMNIARSDDLILILLTVSDTRTVQKKQALFKRIATGLVRELGVRPEDIFINLVETRMENWSFGNGIAQYADRAPAMA